MKALGIAAVMLAAVVRAACVSDPGGIAEPCAAFTTVLTVQDRMSQAANVFNINEPIGFELTTTNTLNAPATLTAGSSCTAVVFEVADANGRHWGNADDIACIQMLQPRTFAPLEVVHESVTWDQRAADGAPVPAGTYTVNALVGQYASNDTGLVDCRVPLGKSATFTIR
jgi:hypothetical protein